MISTGGNYTFFKTSNDGEKHFFYEQNLLIKR